MSLEGGEVRWRLTDIIGAEDGLGVECLSGSGAIASAYSKAFREVRQDFTVDRWFVLTVYHASSRASCETSSPATFVHGVVPTASFSAVAAEPNQGRLDL